MRRRRLSATAILSLLLVLTLFTLPNCVPGTGDAGGGTGTLFNTPPTVVLTASVIRGVAPLTVNFTSVGSTDDGLIVAREWDFGDGNDSPDISPSHVFQTTGEFTVSLTLTDDDGAQSTRTITISVTEAPVAVISVDRTSAESAPAVFNFDGSASYDPDGEVTQYAWDFDDGSLELLPTVAHTFATAGTYRVRLTVTDDTGVTNSSDRIIQVGIPEPEISFRVPPDHIANVAVSPDSPLWVSIVYDSDPTTPRTIRAGLDIDRDPCQAQAALFDTLSGELLIRLVSDLDNPTRGHADRVTAVAFSPNGSTSLTGGEDGTIRLWNNTAGELVRTPDTIAAGAVSSLAFSPDGSRYVYGASNGDVVMMETNSGALLRQFPGHAVAVNAVAFSHDDTRVVSGADDNTAIVWDAQTGGVVQVLGGTPDSHTGAVQAAAFNPANADTVVTGSSDQTAKIWRVSTGGVLNTFSGEHTGAINDVAFSPDGESILTCSDDATALLWSVFGTPGVSRTFSGHSGPVLSGAISPDGLQALTGGSDGSAILWDIATGDMGNIMEPCLSQISSVAFSPDGLEVLLGVGARNDIRLDTDPPNGNDLNLTVPAALDLSVLTADQYPGSYFLWAEVDTDRTTPVRTYAAPQISVVAPFTETANVSTPRVPLISDEAAVLMAPTTDRQIFDLGPLQRGDRLYVSLLTTPGYGEFYDADGFSVLIMDANDEVFAWYQNGYIVFTRDSRLIIGHDSPNYYVVVDGCSPPTCGGINYGQSVMISVDRGVGLVARQQQIYLDFRGGTNLYVGDVGPFTIPAFDANDLNAAWGPVETAVIKQGIVNRMASLYSGYNVTVTTSDAGDPPQGPHQTVYFGGYSFWLFGTSSYIDPRNETLTGSAVVATLTIADAYPGLDAAQMALAIGNVATHESGHLLGLRHTEGLTDIMAVGPDPTSAALEFTTSPLYEGEQYNGQIGLQDAPTLLSEIGG